MQGQPRFKLLILWADRLLMTDKCLSSLILFGENSLPRAVSNYLDHFHHERNHQGKGNLLLFPVARPHLHLPLSRARFVVGSGSGACSSTTIATPHEYFDPTTIRNVAQRECYRVPSVWPDDRDLKAFLRWFDCSFHSMVIDDCNKRPRHMAS
jgi:hypothetical protein